MRKLLAQSRLTAGSSLPCAQVLKQKRLYESQRDQLYNQQFNVDQTSFMMENVQDSVQTVQAMKAAGDIVLGILPVCLMSWVYERCVRARTSADQLPA